MIGQVIRINSGFYDVRLRDRIYRLRASGNLRNNETSPLVGDYVEFFEKKFITRILERKNFFIRPKVANVDQVVIVTSTIEPKFSRKLLNKMLALVEMKNIKPIVFFTKVDLKKSESKEYKNMNYFVFDIDNLKSIDANSKQIKKIFKDKLTVFTGQSGVGKSTTIENISNIKRDIQSISKSLGRGKHTTRIVEILDWANGKLIDTPGFSKFDLDISKLELSKSWLIFRKYGKKCKYKNCLHITENECGIKKAINHKKFLKKFYETYLLISKDLKH